jgi:hypothetical protein
LLLSLALYGQTFRGTILGDVRDAAGASVPGARVTIRNVDTGVERNTVSDETGFYLITELPIGNYSVTVEKEGFQTAVTTDVRVDVATERRVDVSLQPGALEQRIEVEATVTQVDTTSNVLGGTLRTRQVEDLPINGRDFGKLLVLVPGASGDPVGNTDFPGSFGLFTTNGNRGRANNFLLDGTDMNDGYRNLPSINEAGVFGTPATILPLDAIAETRVLTNFETEYGRNGGSVVNIVSKSGTNDLHGSVYEFFRNEDLNARNFFNNVGSKDEFHNNNFGFSLGGPIVRNRTFFYVGYEGQRESGAITTLATVPTPADFAAAITTLGGDPTIPIATNPVVNPVIQNLFALCASTGGCSGGNQPWPAPTANSSFPAGFSNRVDSVIVKVDHNFDANNLLTGRYFYGDSDQSFPLGLAGGNNLPNTNTFTPTTVQLISLSYVHIASPSKVFETRFGWNRFNEDFLADDRDVFGNPDTTLGLNTGVSNPRDFGLPTLRVSGLASLGSSPFSNPRGRVDTNWHVIENFSWKAGAHDWKFGFEFRRTFVNSFIDVDFRSRLNFTGDTTGDPLADFLGGFLSFGDILSGDTQRGTFQNSWAGYVQDSWRVTPRFTFNWGLRYDYYGVLDEERNRFSRYDPTQGLLQMGTDFDRLYDRDPNNFGPRLSVAWDPWGDGKTVIRAGWGLFYDAFSQDFFIGQIVFNSFSTGVAYNPIGESPIFQCFSNNPALPVDPISGASVLVPGVAVFDPNCFIPGVAGESTDVTQADPDLRTPYVQNYNLNIQRELWKNSVLQVAYVGSQGRKLFRTREINQSPVPGGLRPFDTGAADLGGATAPGTLPFIVNQLETTANSYYNSLQVSLTQRNWHGWTNSASWTWGHSIDNASDGMESVVNQSAPDFGGDPGRERANSNFDTRQRFVWSWIYDLPGGNSRLTKGWQLAGILTLQSGHPFNLNIFGSSEYDFILRPDLVGDPFLGRSTPDRYLNLAAFALPCALFPGGTSTGDCDFSSTTNPPHYGTLPRNFFVSPNYRNLDLSIVKNTAITERVTIQFRADFYNLTNHPNFAAPTLPSFIAPADFQGINPGGTPLAGRGGAAGSDCTTTASDPNCFLPIVATPDTGIGYPSLGGGGPRNVQFALKVIF